jgi:ubiquitin-like 1-activating enzyme E1 B
LLKRGETRCYDCFPRAENKKTYPACTIRTLPEKPVHCIIWAKYLFTVLFNAQPEDTDEEGSNLLADIAKYISDSTDEATDRENALKLFTAIYSTDVSRQKEGEDNVKF